MFSSVFHVEEEVLADVHDRMEDCDIIEFAAQGAGEREADENAAQREHAAECIHGRGDGEVGDFDFLLCAGEGVCDFRGREVLEVRVDGEAGIGVRLPRIFAEERIDAGNLKAPDFPFRGGTLFPRFAGRRRAVGELAEKEIYVGVFWVGGSEGFEGFLGFGGLAALVVEDAGGVERRGIDGGE